MHADGDWQIVEGLQSKDMTTVGEYLQTCKLKLSTTKAVLAVFTSTTRKTNVSWKSTTTRKPCPFVLGPHTSDECSIRQSRTSDTSSHFVKSWHHALHPWGGWLGAGAITLQKATLPWPIQQQSTGLLSGAAVLTPASLTCHQGRLANCDWMLASYTSEQSFYARRHPTCWASSQRSHTVSSTPCHGAWTRGRDPLSAHLSIEWECRTSQIETPNCTRRPTH